MTLFVTWLLFTGKGPAVFLSIWLIFGYAGVVLLPATWLLRYAIERIEIGDKYYRHYFANIPWWFPKKWAVDEITRIDFGYVNEESIATLNVRRRRQRDMIAYWAQKEFRRKLFDAIREHLAEIGSRIEVVDLTQVDP